MGEFERNWDITPVKSIIGEVWGMRAHVESAGRSGNVFENARLLAEVRKSSPQWGARDLNQATERCIHLQDQKDRARNRQPGDD